MSNSHNSDPGNLAAEAEGSRHWKLQRISAVALVPLSLWFMFSIIDRVGTDYQSMMLWVSNPLIAISLLLYLLVMFFHAQLGIEVVMEDYVHTESLRVRCLWMSKAIFIICGLVSVYAVFRLIL